MRFKHIFLLVFVFILTSCEELLETEPTSSLSTEEALADYTIAKSALVGIYDVLSGTGWYGRNYVINAEVTATDARLKPENSGRFIYEYFYTYAPDLGTMNRGSESLYTRGYNMVSRANNVINSVESGATTGGTPEQLDQLVSEAKFLRALAYHDMVKLFAQDYTYTSGGSHLGIPIITETNFGPVARATVSEVYDLILADLTDALAKHNADDLSLAAPYSASEAAIKALMARVYLYKEDWANAKTYADDVINNYTYALVSNADYVASWGQVSTSESIFDISMTTTDNRGVDAIGAMLMPAGYGDIVPTAELLGLYEGSDVRAGLYFSEGSFTYSSKYPGRNGLTGVDNTKVLRLSEMYMIVAEAEARMSNYGNASTYFNAIRTRAGASSITLDASNYEQAILDERRREFCFEGHRLFDMKRMHQSIVRGSECTAQDKCTINYPSHLFAYPFSLNETNVNNLLVQNDGY